MTIDPATVRERLATWTAVGLEGVVYKRLAGVYEPAVCGWRKYKLHETEDAVVGATHRLPGGSPHAAGGPVRHRRAPTVRGAEHDAPACGRPGGRRIPCLAADHPWAGRTSSAGWGTRETLHVTLVVPELVVQVGVDVARDGALTGLSAASGGSARSGAVFGSKVWPAVYGRADWRGRI
ncbi:hypothetical protein J3S85_37290 [Streptomyces lavenduligriseus]|nr:hypothetical protein J3S85_37290 [Streptomyces lavenduligriseus]